MQISECPSENRPCIRRVRRQREKEREVQYDHSILKIAYIRIEYKIVTNCTTDSIIGEK